MNVNLISNILPERLIHALGWSILHSLWLGALVALGFGLLMVFMRRSSSRTRYYTGVGALALILLVSSIGFVSIYNSGSNVSFSTTDLKQGGSFKISSAPAGNTSEDVAPQVMGPSFTYYFNRHLPLVVTIWFLGVLVLLLRFGGGFLYNQRLKVHGIHAPAKPWQEKLDGLCHRLKAKKPVRLLESALVKAPVTIGHFKPVILFPLGMISGMPVTQVEALLSHELAHITRKDYLINILQNLVDILYFYHPAVRWLSAAVRNEREHCCDDMAVLTSGNSLEYARALANIEAPGTWNMEPALAATGKKYRLLERIKRLVPHQKTGTESKGSVLAAVLMGLCFISLVAMVGLNEAENGNTATVPVKMENSAVPQYSGLENAAINMHRVLESSMESPENNRSGSTSSNKQTSSSAHTFYTGSRKKKDPKIFEFTVINRAFFEFSGESKQNNTFDTWITNIKSNKKVWELKKNIEKKHGIYQFIEGITLEKGDYKWYSKGKDWKLSIRVKNSGKITVISKDTAKPIFFFSTDEKNIPGNKLEKRELNLREKELAEKQAQWEKEMEEKVSRQEKELAKALAKERKELEAKEREMKSHEIELEKKIAKEKALQEKEMEKALAKKHKELEAQEKEMKLHEKELEKKIAKEQAQREKEMEKALAKQRKEFEAQEKELAQHQIELEKKYAKEKALREKEMAQAKAKHEEELKRQQKELELTEKEMAKRQAEMKKEMEVQMKKQQEELKKQEQKLREEEAFIKSVGDEIVRDGLVKDDAQSIRLILSERELEINDVKQPEPVFRKYKKMFKSRYCKKMESRTIFNIKRREVGKIDL